MLGAVVILLTAVGKDRVVAFPLVHLLFKKLLFSLATSLHVLLEVKVLLPAVHNQRVIGAFIATLDRGFGELTR